MTAEQKFTSEDTPTDANDPEGVAQEPAPGEDGDRNAPLTPGTDLNPEEGADVFETEEQASEKQRQRDDVRSDEDIISLDGSD